MPDRLVDEETKTRSRSLCLYGVQGITRTNNRRCANCPGPARTPDYHQRRCPLDMSNEPNLFVQEAAAQGGKSDVIVDPKTLFASSSIAVQPVDENVAVEPKSDETSDISLDGRSQPSGRRRPARLDVISSFSTDRSVSDPHSEVIGRKRKADDWPESSSRNEVAHLQGEEIVRSPKKLHREESLVQGLHSLSIAHEDDHPQGDNSLDTVVVAAAHISLNQPEGSLRTKQAGMSSMLAKVNERTKLSGNQLDGRSDVREFLSNKEQIIFGDLPDDEPALKMDWAINASRNASPSSLFANPNIMQEGYDPNLPALISSLRIRVPGIGMISAHQGVPSGSDGIYNANNPQEYGLMSAMEIVWPSDDELRNE